jgi:hypothetical protein
MRRFYTRYLTALLCMLAVGTWILPVHTLAAPAPRDAASSNGDPASGTAHEALVLMEWIEAMRLAGEFDRPAFAYNGADLTGDGVEELVEVSPPQRLETPGVIRVVDGATGAERYTLRAPVGEGGFGEYGALVSDADGDGLADIAVWSSGDADQDPLSLFVRARLRVYSGVNGAMIGLLQAVQEIGSPPLELQQFEVSVAGDANHDGVLDGWDVIDAASDLSHSAVRAPSVDCRADGVLTMEDLTSVIDRVIEEPQAQRATNHSMTLRNLEIIELIAPPGSGVNPIQTGAGGGVPPAPCVLGWVGGPSCWSRAALIGLSLTKLVLKLKKCLALGGPASPAFLACALMNICMMISVIGQIVAFILACWTNGNCVPAWVEWLGNGIGVVGALCDLGMEQLDKGMRELLQEMLEALLTGGFRGTW